MYTGNIYKSNICKSNICKKNRISGKTFKGIAVSIIIIILAAGAVFAGSEDFEPLYFDGGGRLSFETVDNVAVRTAYKTLGWTIKKYDLPIDDPSNITVTCMLHDESYVGEDGRAHTFFYVNREDVLAKTAQVSGEWSNELRSSGGVVYFDSIMTVCQNGIRLGELYDDGSWEGEVYFTYDGISTARWWRNPEDLKQDYDRRVVVEPDPTVAPPPPPPTEAPTEPPTEPPQPTQPTIAAVVYRIVGTH